MAIRHATRSKAPIGASEMPSIGAAYQAFSPRSALLPRVKSAPAEIGNGTALTPIGFEANAPQQLGEAPVGPRGLHWRQEERARLAVVISRRGCDAGPPPFTKIIALQNGEGRAQIAQCRAGLNHAECGVALRIQKILAALAGLG